MPTPPSGDQEVLVDPVWSEGPERRGYGAGWGGHGEGQRDRRLQGGAPPPMRRRGGGGDDRQQAGCRGQTAGLCPARPPRPRTPALLSSASAAPRARPGEAMGAHGGPCPELWPPVVWVFHAEQKISVFLRHDPPPPPSLAGPAVSAWCRRSPAEIGSRATPVLSSPSRRSAPVWRGRRESESVSCLTLALLSRGQRGPA